MSAFTFTAPIVTEAEAKAEWKALSEDEKKAYTSEMQGTDKDFVETPALLEEQLKVLHDTLEATPDPEKNDYLRALQVPGLVEGESSPVAFLRATRFCGELAARRLISYWRVRTLIFGPERAFLPMTLEGSMAEDVQYLQRAMVVMLQDDARGRAVFFLDRIRCTREIAPRDSIARCFFYALQTFGEKEHYQKRGLVGIMNYRSFDIYKHFDRILTKKVVHCLNCMPLPLKGWHVCTGSGASVTTELVLPILRQMVGKDFRLRLQLHAGSTSEILARFKLYGLGEAHVHAVFGNYVGNRPALEAWLQARTAEERARRVLDEEQQNG